MLDAMRSSEVIDLDEIEDAKKRALPSIIIEYWSVDKSWLRDEIAYVIEQLELKKKTAPFKEIAGRFVGVFLNLHKNLGKEWNQELNSYFVKWLSQDFNKMLCIKIVTCRMFTLPAYLKSNSFESRSVILKFEHGDNIEKLFGVSNEGEEVTVVDNVARRSIRSASNNTTANGGGGMGGESSKKTAIQLLGAWKCLKYFQNEDRESNASGGSQSSLTLALEEVD